ncbi:MAG: tRNA lysidine(34) synthetase TilS [Sphaerochaetaceae bacterium]
MSTTDAKIATDLLKPNDTVLCAFSGGADSLALLILLKAYLKEGNLTALYINHNLRDSLELEKEVSLNQKNCETLNVPLKIVTIEKDLIEKSAKERGNGIEEAARYHRYKELQRTAKELNCKYIATAHNSDDQAETILMGLLQGSVVEGISRERANIIRPILHLSREEIEQIVKQSNLKWANDSTNDQLYYLRNKVRHTIVAPIKETFSGYKRALNRVVEQNRRLLEAIEPEVEKLVGKATVSEESITIGLDDLRNSSDAVIEQTLYRLWNLFCEKRRIRLSQSTIELILEKKQNNFKSDIFDIKGATVEINSNTLILRREKDKTESFCATVDSKETFLTDTMVLVETERENAHIYLKESCLLRPLLVRSVEESDRITLKEGTKKVTDLFSEWKIENSKRWRVPLLVDAKGVVAVLASQYGGKNRVAARCLFSSPLAHKSSTYYSVVEIKGNECG